MLRLSLYHINLYFLQLWPTFWVSRCRGFLVGSNSLNRLQLSCSLSHLQAGSTVMLANYRWDTGLMGKNTCSPSRRNRETDSASSDSVSTKSEHWKHVYSMCLVSNAGWLLVVQGERGWHHRERQPSLCPWPISTFHDRSHYAQKLHVPTLVEKTPADLKTSKRQTNCASVLSFTIYNIQWSKSVAVNKLQDSKKNGG